jgi:hypothetical protein
MENSTLSKMHKQCLTICNAREQNGDAFNINPSDIQDCSSNSLPSSIDINTFPSGDKAIERMFFRFSNGKVRDLFLD